MIQQNATVSSLREVADGVFSLTFQSDQIARTARPGQFVNIRVTHGCIPLLRRPFSIASIQNSTLEILFNVVGQGTHTLAGRRRGDEIDVLGPLGTPFGLSGQFETAILVAGGLGVAPFPLLTEWLKREGKNIASIVGARTAKQLVAAGLEGVHFATDDGSKGFQGNVVDCLEMFLNSRPIVSPKIFGCGPTPMLKALSDFAQRVGLDCELSLEGDMACGIGLCQGCPVERRNGRKKYALVCTEGPTFNCEDIILQ